jgi:hypothetical protein
LTVESRGPFPVPLCLPGGIGLGPSTCSAKGSSDGGEVDFVDEHCLVAWSELKSSEERKHMVMPVCVVRGVAKARGETTKLFELRKAGCKVDHGGESPQHLAMKEDCIDRVPGWHCIVEHPHRSRE